MLPLGRLVSTVIRSRLPIQRSPPFRFQRQFSLTPRTQAAEVPESFINAFKSTSLYKKLANNPEALAALSDFAKVLQEQGLDLASGKQPSTLQMIKAASNAQFRESAKRVAEEMQKAGIDLKSQDVMQELMDLQKVGKGGS